jgi:hypothetical protein
VNQLGDNLNLKAISVLADFIRLLRMQSCVCVL